MLNWAIVLLSIVSLFVLAILICGICSIVTKDSIYVKTALGGLLLFIIALVVAAIGVLMFVFWGWISR